MIFCSLAKSKLLLYLYFNAIIISFTLFTKCKLCYLKIITFKIRIETLKV